MVLFIPTECNMPVVTRHAWTFIVYCLRNKRLAVVRHQIFSSVWIMFEIQSKQHNKMRKAHSKYLQKSRRKITNNTRDDSQSAVAIANFSNQSHNEPISCLLCLCAVTSSWINLPWLNFVQTKWSSLFAISDVSFQPIN